jgi:hypothetical protein
VRFLQDILVAFSSAFLSLICGGLVGSGLLVVLQFVQSWGVAAAVGLLPLAVILSAAGFLLRSNKAVARLSGDALLVLGGMLSGAWFGLIALDYVTLPKGVDDFGYAPLCSGVTGTLVTGILFRRASNPALNRSGKIIIVLGSFLLTLVGESLVRESRLAVRSHWRRGNRCARDRACISARRPGGNHLCALSPLS